MPTLEYTIPFEVLRLLIPEDGKVAFRVLLKKADKSKSLNSDSFYKCEMLEVVLNKKIRARKKKRIKEKPFNTPGPGIKIERNKIVFRAGRRLNKKILGKRFHHGTLKGKIQLLNSGGAIKPNVIIKVTKLKVIPKGGAIALTLDLINKVSGVVNKNLKEEIEKSLAKKLVKIFNKNILKRIAKASSVEANGATLTVKIVV